MCNLHFAITLRTGQPPTGSSRYSEVFLQNPTLFRGYSRPALRSGFPLLLHRTSARTRLGRVENAREVVSNRVGSLQDDFSGVYRHTEAQLRGPQRPPSSLNTCREQAAAVLGLPGC